MSASRRLLALALFALLQPAGGCRHAPRADVAPVPPAAAPAQGGQLLHTGAIQLGPGVGQNAWRWQGDGEWGFASP